MPVIVIVLWSSIAAAAFLAIVHCAAVLCLHAARRRQSHSPASTDAEFQCSAVSVLLDGPDAPSRLAAWAWQWIEAGRSLENFEILAPRTVNAPPTIEWAHLQETQCVRTVLVPPDANIAERRGAALACARYPVIAIPEAGVVPDAGSLAYLVRAFESPRIGLLFADHELAPCRAPAHDTLPLGTLRADARSLLDQELPRRAEIVLFRPCLGVALCDATAARNLQLAERARQHKLRVTHRRFSGIGWRATERANGWAGWRRELSEIAGCLRRLPHLWKPWSRHSLLFWCGAVGPSLIPVFLAVAFLANLPLSQQPSYLKLLLAQEAVYLALAYACFRHDGSEAPRHLRPALASQRPEELRRAFPGIHDSAP